MMSRLLALSAFLAVVGFGSQLSAQSLSYPGVNCRYYGPVGNDVYFNPSGLGANGVKNTSASSYYVTCPITKTMTKGVHAASIILDDDSTECRLYARSVYGVSSFVTPSVIRRADVTTYEYAFEWGDSSDPADTTTWAASRSATTAIYCRIDAGKSIRAYQSIAY